jgi:glutathione synthase/RimK-type ligase-like ATP-grasp enzyme
MDPIDQVDVSADTSFLMIENARLRGHTVWTYHPDQMAQEDGKITARARHLVGAGLENPGQPARARLVAVGPVRIGPIHPGLGIGPRLVVFAAQRGGCLWALRQLPQY